jgi:quinone-modifying oxidoreductase subunit QmoC
MEAIPQTIKHEADCDPGFPRAIMARPGGEKLFGCIQCGTCSAACPVSGYMDATPRQLILLTRAGFKQEVLRSRTIWLCASCYACAVVCPKEISITDVMYALKRAAIQEGVYPRRFPIPVLAREFAKMVRARGRVTENRLAAKLFWKTNWIAMLQSWRLGLQLLRTGRFPFRAERMRETSALRRLLEDTR